MEKAAPIWCGFLLEKVTDHEEALVLSVLLNPQTMSL